MEITKKDVGKLIELKKENTFLNHLWNVISRDFRPKGEIRETEIKIWKQNSWNSTFYPVFTFEFNANNCLTNIRDNLNPIGKGLIGLFLIGFLYFIFQKKVFDIDLTKFWVMIIFLLTFGLITALVARKIYLFEKQNQLDEILEILDIEIEEKKPEKEWSLKKILIRLFTYPFSIFIIFICTWNLLENGIKGIFMALFGIGICGMYLYSDIKTIIENKKTTGNTV